MKNFYFFSFLFLFLIGCNNSDINPIIKSKKIRLNETSNETSNRKNDILLAMTSPNRHYDPNCRRCFTPAHDCFPDIVVTAPKLSFIKELDSLIQINHTYKFFQPRGNSEELFPGLYGPALVDLVESLTTLRKGISSDSTIFYHIVFVSDTNLAPDYSEYY